MGRQAAALYQVGMKHTTVIHLQPWDLDSLKLRPHYSALNGSPWSKFIAICRLLHRDGLDYDVTIQPYAYSILIRGKGRVRTKRPPKSSYSIPDPPTEVQARKALDSAVKSLATCRRQLVEKWRWWRGSGYPLPAWDGKRQQSKRAWGKWLASRLARRPRGFRDVDRFVPNLSDYKSGDETFGRVPRLSKLNAHERESLGWAVAVARRLNVYFTWRHGYKPSEPTKATVVPDETSGLTQPAWVAHFLSMLPQDEVYNPLWEYRRAKAEVEYWQEILKLLEERNGHKG